MCCRREGKEHILWNPQTEGAEAVPGHTEIANVLAIKICRHNSRYGNSAKNLAQAQEALHHPGVDRAVISEDSVVLFGLALVASFGVILVDED